MNNNSGNALFLILIAVALFAALSYAVTSSGRGGSGIDKEQAQIAVSEMLQWMAMVDTAITRMRIVQGLSYKDISLGYEGASTYGGTPITNYAHNTLCTTDECKIFDTAGGNVSPPDFTAYATPDPTGITAGNLAPGYMVPVMMQWPNAGTTSNDIAMLFGWMDPTICNRLNDTMGINAIPTVAGTYNAADTVANWDNAGYTLSLIHI